MNTTNMMALILGSNGFVRIADGHWVLFGRGGRINYTLYTTYTNVVFVDHLTDETIRYTDLEDFCTVLDRDFVPEAA